MNEKDEEEVSGLEADINALLDGELDSDAMEALKAAAAKDSRLAQAIVEAWQLQHSMDRLQLEKAPASLSRKLKRIPREQRDSARKWLGVPRWAAAAGLASVAGLALAMMMTTTGPVGPGTQPEVAVMVDAERAEKARQDLEIAFYYLDRAGFRVGEEIHDVLQDEIAAPVKDNLSKRIPYTEQSRKEKQA